MCPPQAAVRSWLIAAPSASVAARTFMTATLVRVVVPMTGVPIEGGAQLCQLGTAAVGGGAVRYRGDPSPAGMISARDGELVLVRRLEPGDQPRAFGVASDVEPRYRGPRDRRLAVRTLDRQSLRRQAKDDLRSEDQDPLADREVQESQRDQAEEGGDDRMQSLQLRVLWDESQEEQRGAHAEDRWARPAGREACTGWRLTRLRH